MKKLLIALVMMAVIVSTMFAMSVSASAVDVEYDAWTGAHDGTFDGSWTAVNSIAGIKSAVEAGNTKLYMTADIAVEAVDFTGITGFTLDGNGYSFIYDGDAAVFSGADNYTIKNLKLTGTLASSACAPIADVASITVNNVVSDVAITTTAEATRGGIVANVTGVSSFTDAVFHGTMASGTKGSSGGIVGYAKTVDGTSFIDCENYAKIDAYDAGGIVGTADKKVTIKDCTNYGSIAGVRTSGGIAGWLKGASSTVENCVNGVQGDANTAAITGDYTGGMVGAMHAASGSMTDCVNYGSVAASLGSKQFGGGMAGQSYAASYTNCDNYGAVSAFKYAGGVVAIQSNNAVKFTNCDNKGNVTSTMWAGGIVGYSAKKATASYCTSEATIKLTGAGTAKDAYCVGGIAGRSLGGPEFSNCTVKGAIVVDGLKAYVSGTNYSDVYVAGIIGHSSEAGSKHTSCTNEATITVSNSTCIAAVAGIVGRSNNSISITSCTNKGAITVSGDAVWYYQLRNVESGKEYLAGWSYGVGGIMGNGGHDTQVTTIDRCNNSGTITVSGPTSVGGIFGYYCAGSGTLEIKDCVNTGNITHTFTETVKMNDAETLGDGETKLVLTTRRFGTGGLVGWGRKVVITGANGGSRNEGKVSLTANVTGTIKSGDTKNKDTVFYNLAAYAGGVIGYAEVAQPNISGTTNSGEVSYSVSVGITATNAKASGASTAGGFIGRCEKGAVINGCTNIGKVSGSNVGGFIGATGGNLDLDNCTNNAQIIATNTAGGIVCTLASGTTANIDGCVNLGYVEGKYRAAGIVAYVYGKVLANNCVNGAEGTDKGGIKATGADAWGAAGGILGWVETSNDGVLKGCINYGAIYATGTGTNDSVGQGGAGGIVGKPHTKVTIGGTGEGEACINYGSVTAAGVVKAGGIAGFVGTSGNASVIISCENYGEVTSATHAGGIVGEVRADMTITCAKNFANVTAGSMAAGIVANATKNLTIKNCVNGYANEHDKITIYNTGVGNTQPLGGIVACVGTNLYAEGCYNYAKLSNPMSNVADGMTTADKLYNGAKHVGGIAGQVKGSAFVGYYQKTTGEGEEAVTTLEKGVGCFNYGTIETVGFGHTSYIGGIVGYDDGGASKIYGSENHGNIVILNKGYNGSYHGVGGIMGYAQGKVKTETESFTTTIIDCANYGNITIPETPVALWVAGGIVGGSWAKDGFVLEITGCYNEGEITAHHVGGIGGRLQGAVVITDCENAGAITTNATVIKDAADYKGDYNAGGILGTSTSSITISNSINTGAVTATTTSARAGGILGYTKVATTVSECTNTGTIKTQFVGGGIVGWTEGSTEMKIQNCVNGVEGDATKGIIEAGDSNDYIGGIAGALQNGKATDCTNYGAVNGIGGDYTGGIAGQLYGNGSINGSKNYGAVISTEGNAGGLVGGAGANVKVEDAENRGNVTAMTAAGGFFGTLAGNATLNDKCINIGAVTATSHAGGFVGFVSAAATIDGNGATNEGHIKGSNVAGVVAYTEGNITIYDFNNSGIIEGTGSGSAGGVLGYSLKAKSLTVTIDNCHNTGNISCHCRAGGITGWTNGTTKITNCTNGVEGDPTKGTITVPSGGDTWSGAGGIASYIMQGSGEIKGCINYANVSCSGYVANAASRWMGVGGIIGNAAVSLTIGGTAAGEACVNYGNVSTVGPIVGGLVGVATGGLTIKGNATNLNTNHGSVVANGMEIKSGDVALNTLAYVGGIVGYTKGTTNIAYAKNTGAISDKAITSGTVNYCSVGGVLGYSDGTVTISNSINTGKITGLNKDKSCVGGIIGLTKVSTTITNCNNEGIIETLFTGGGIVGWTNTDAATLTGCINGVQGDVSKGIIIAGESNDYIGGIVGALHTGKATGCVNYGAVQGIGGEKTGGITGELKTGGSVDNSLNYGSVSSTSGNAGGIVGIASGAVTITGAKNYGNVTAGAKAAGIVADAEGNLTVKNCVNGYANNIDGTIIHNTGVGSTQPLGGIVAYVKGNLYAEGCYNYAKLYNPMASVDEGTTTANKLYNGAKHVAGIAAQVTGSAFVGYYQKTTGEGDEAVTTLEKGVGCFNYGTIETVAFGHTSYIGGIVGYDEGSASKFYGCENHGNIVLINKGYNGSYHGAGGILGYAQAKEAANTVTTIINCKNYGNITVPTNSVALWVAGGILGGTWAKTGFSVIIDGCYNEGEIDAHYVGGIGGRIEAPITVSNCVNKGELYSNMITINSSTSGFKGDYGIGGIVGYAKEVLTIENCVNDASITCIGTHTGGIVGVASTTLTITSCENKGNITHTENRNAYTGVGGMVGYAAGTNKVTTITYCINNGNIKHGDGSTGYRTYFAGMIGRAANPNYYVITYSINNGDMTAAAAEGYAAGFIGWNQSYGAAADYTANTKIESCTNTGNITANYAAGFIASCNLGASATVDYNCFRAINCTNTGNITGVSYAGGFAGIADATFSYEDVSYNGHTIYTLTNCVTTGEIFASAGTAAGAIARMDNVQAIVDGCIITGKVSGNKAYVLAPKSSSYDNYEDSFTNCYYNLPGTVTNTTYVATQKSADEIRDLIRGEGTTTVIFDRDNLAKLYQWAEAKQDASLTELMNALAPYINNTGVGYFTATQYEADLAYDALYNAMYPAGTETTFVVIISDQISLDNGGKLNLQFNNPTPKSKLSVSVKQNGLASGANFKLTSGAYELNFWLTQNGKEVRNNQNLFEFDWSSVNGEYSFGAVIEDENKLYPAVYTGTLTFTVTYEDVQLTAE